MKEPFNKAYSFSSVPIRILLQYTRPVFVRLSYMAGNIFLPHPLDALAAVEVELALDDLP